MAEEIELKLALPPTAQRALLRHPLLVGAGRPTRERLANVYYDTPELALRDRGMALRLRRQGPTLLQTVKCAGQSAGGLSARPEWETPYTGRFDFAAIDAPKVRRWLERPKIADRLVPVFETDFNRTTWRLEAEPGRAMLVMLDRGWIAADGRREPISELEIELVGADAAALFELAGALAERVPLVPAIFSKAERGYRLFADEPIVPVKAVAPAIDACMSPLAAFRAIGLACVDQLQGNHVGLLHDDDPEFVHQMRVAARRLRAALRLFAPRLDKGLAATLLPGLRSLMARLGAVRDLDVLLEEIVEPVIADLPDDPRLAALATAVRERRDAARSAAREHLASPDYARLLLQIVAVLNRPAIAAGSGPAEPLARLAAKRLRRLHDKAVELADAAGAGDDPASLHRLRIGIKRLRYAAEFFTPLAPAKRWPTLLRTVAELQDRLGQLNDLASAGPLLIQSADNDATLLEAVARVGEWHRPQYTAVLRAARRDLKRFEQLKLPRLE